MCGNSWSNIFLLILKSTSRFSVIHLIIAFQSFPFVKLQTLSLLQRENNSWNEKSGGFSSSGGKICCESDNRQGFFRWCSSRDSISDSSQGRPFQGFLRKTFPPFWKISPGEGFLIDVSDKLTRFSLESWAVGLSLIAPFRPPLFGNWRGALGQGRV